MSIVFEYSSTNRGCTFLICILIIIVVALASYIVYKEVKEDEVKTRTKRGDNPDYIRRENRRGWEIENQRGKKNRHVCRAPLRYASTKKDVLRLYGDLFKTKREQQKIERKYYNPNSNNIVQAPPGNNVSFTYYDNLCNNRQQSGDFNQTQLGRRKKRSTFQFVAHGCCTSFRVFSSPDTAISDGSLQEVTLVSFTDDRQYFLVDICWHEQSCHVNCGCRKQTGLFEALIHNPSYNSFTDEDGDGEDANGEPKYLIHRVQIGGSCKCENNVSPGMIGR